MGMAFPLYVYFLYVRLFFRYIFPNKFLKLVDIFGYGSGCEKIQSWI